jgi:cytochrome c-type biogenesis protein CcmE
MGKNLDEELAKAAGLGDGDHAAMAVPQPAEPPPDPEPRPDAPRAGRGLLLMLLVMVGSIVALFLFAFKPAAIYAMPVEQLLAKREEHVGKRVRIDGELLPGTLQKRDKPCEFRFKMRGSTERTQNVDVRFAGCIVPDAFRDVPEGGVMVTAEGTLTPAGHFEATSIMAKCSSKYDPKTHTMDGEKKTAPQAVD